MIIPHAVTSEFAARFGEDPTHVVVAPGRVNLIGEHIDYIGLSVFPMALNRGITLVFRARRDTCIRVASSLPEHEPREFALSTELTPYGGGDWGDYVKAGALAALTAGPGLSRGMDAYVDSTLPAAAGLSSSSALVVAVLLALLEVNHVRAERSELMGIAARAERFVGTRGGGMDHAICLGARAGTAARIDFDPVRVTHVPFTPEWRWLVAFSGVRAAKSAAAQAVYNQRTEECQEALERVWQAMGESEQPPSYRTLIARHAQYELLGQAFLCLPRLLHDRFRHVVTEAYRVHDAVAALRANDEGWFGQLMIESHMSLRKDYNVSAEELDALVLAAQDARAVGARLTGAGFGGSVVVLVGTPRFAPVRAALEHVLAKAGKPDAEVFEVFAGGAARVEELDV